jgi:glutathione S-transferase
LIERRHGRSGIKRETEAAAMVTLYTFGPYFGLPDGSPFVVKAMLLLKFAGLEYSENRGGYGKAPKGKLPYINDGGVIVADSTFVRFHIEKKYGFDFDAGLTPEQRAAAWAAEKMCQEHLYFALVATRWLDDANFAKRGRPNSSKPCQCPSGRSCKA